ncbi:uncharacterized protein LOC113217431 isoform X2 [Frankliniella occidentalis]|nr:uncharacterized protein LOC113217431 isoform X2 [Frankliniella occidentalis]
MRNVPLAVLLCVVRAVLAFTTLRSNSYAGPYRILFKEVTQCTEGTVSPGAWVLNLTGNILHPRSVKSPVFNGQMIMRKDVGVGDVGITIAVAKWDSVAGWRENFFRIDGGEWCNVVATIGQTAFEEVSRHSMWPRSCPQSKGTYFFRNLSTDMVQRWEHFPVFPYGRFRGDLLYYVMKSKQTIVGCFRGVTEIVPKMKRS